MKLNIYIDDTNENFETNKKHINLSEMAMEIL